MERSSGRYLQLIRGGAKLLTRNQLGKVRQKRQALQDMARPLKQWLYKHRDNPYPTKTEKILLALGSHMTLVQVSNWFANARRRLKNTVRQPDLSWALRIKLYNKYVQGNAERLSVSSDETPSDDSKQLSPMPSSHFSRASHDTAIQDCKELEPSKNFSISDEVVSHPKYKNSLLNRYLNDSLRHVMASENLLDSQKRNHSASFQNFPCHTVTLDHGRESIAQNRGSHRTNETYWKELHAAMVLTNMAEVKEAAEASTSRSIISTSISSSRNSIISSSSSPLLTTSCIIQKSSHIAEIKTVRMGTFKSHVIQDGLSEDC